MSIKNLFGKTVTNYKDVAADVESTDFIDEVVAKRETYLPPIDFADPKNFVFYGSAELYYEAAIKRIYEDYPYDGSKAEQIEFEEKSSYLERWLYDNKYPKTTGHVVLGTSANLTTATGVYSNTTVPEYIRVWGGLHTDSTSSDLDYQLDNSAKYDAENNRTQNFNCDFTKGVTIEFWMKKSTYTSTNREIILDLWNGQGFTGDYSRLVLETFDDGSGTKKMAITISTGAVSTSTTFTIGTAETDWNHYAISVIDGASDTTLRFYENGEESNTTTTGSGIGILGGRLNGFIGALQAATSGLNGATNGGKLSAQLDEFRFWKTRRTSRQIKLNWFREIGGGANTDDNTSDLGVYLKFNEGITGTSSIDSKVLDYSGRLANGLWVGYSNTTSARSTDSAMTTAGYTEKPTPIVYSTHPSVTALEAEMTLSGSDYDSGRGQAFYRSLPNWLVEEDQTDGDENLRKISHILSSYMDTLKVQIDSLNTLQDKQYLSASYKSTPFASELLRDKGFTTSEMFLSSEVFETFSNIDYGADEFELNLDEIKNLIFTNIYNNLENIYNSKGTEKSIRNLIRCFGIDDELIKLNQYTDNGTQYLENKYRTTSVKKKYVNLNSPANFSATMYQSGSRTFISGSTNASVAAFTMEADTLVPYKKELGENGFFATPFLSASVMGFHEAMPTNASNFTWWADQLAATAAATGFFEGFSGTFSVSAFEGKTYTLTDTNGLTKTYEFTSSGTTGTILPNGNILSFLQAGVANTLIKMAAAINHSNGHAGSITAARVGFKVNLTQAVAGANGNTNLSTNLASTFLSTSHFTGGTSTFKEARDLQVYLVRDSSESKHGKFVIKNQSETIKHESDYVYDIYNNEHYNVALRIKPQTYPYAGNVTNTTPNYDIELYAVSHNFDEIKEQVLISTVVDYLTGSAYLTCPKRIYAASHYENFTGSILHKTDLQFGRVSAWLDYLPNSSIQEHNKDIMNYGNFKAIDGSNAFTITDMQVPSMDLSILNWDFDTVATSDSSGEFVITDTTSGSSDTIYGWVDNIIRREYDGKGDNFPASTTTFLSNEFLYANKKQLPETSFNTNNIFIKGEQQINFGTDDDVSDNLFILEKSPSAIVSEEMLKLFSTTQEFSNLFGRHIDRYRLDYKDLARARQLFYERADSGLDFDKFFNYFKWIDQSISEMVNQLIPASVNFAGGVTDIIEPHILERDKYQRRVGLLQTVTSTEASMRGVQELNYNWRIGHAPLPTAAGGLPPYDQNSLWQHERRARATTDAEIIRVAAIRQTDQEFTNPITLSGSSPTGIYSGSTYATRRFSRPVRVGIDLNRSIHGGINYVESKDRDLMKSGIGLHSPIGPSGAPKNVITFGAGLGDGLNVLEVEKDRDTFGPNEKVRYDGFGMMGRYTDFVHSEYAPISPETDYYSRRKVCNLFIGNIVSSSVDTGYHSLINKVDTGFRVGVNVVNLHSDTTDITNVIPIQGPFTNHWVGGRQSRHTALNSTGKFRNATSAVPNDLDSEFSRPEEWRLLVGKNPILNTGSIGDIGFIEPDQDGALGFTAPDYGLSAIGTWPDSERLYSIFYREERAKRPLNIKNIQTTTSSVSHGNYQHEYEVFSTFGDQGYFLKRAGNLLPESIGSTLPETTNYATLVAQSTGLLGNLQLNAPDGVISNRFTSGTFATMTITAVSEATLTSPPTSHDRRFTLTDANGVTTTFKINVNSSHTGNSAAYSPGIETTLFIGGLTTQTQIRDTIAVKINAMNPPSFTAAIVGSTLDKVLITQNTVGTTGNTGITFPNGSIHFGFSGPNSFQGGSFGVNDQPTQDRSTGSVHVIRTQFSAPGGPEVNSPAYLDVATQQFSVYNSMNFRNLTVVGDSSGEEDTIRVNSFSNRREGLRILRARHQGQFGIDSKHGVIRSEDYVTEASFHKQHRNGSKVENRTDFSKTGVKSSVLIVTVKESDLTSAAGIGSSDNHRFTLTDANGVTTTFRISAGLNISINSSQYTAGTQTDFGLVTITNTRAAMRDQLIIKINKMNPPSFTATEDGDNVLITQNTVGASGNTEITFPDGAIKFAFQSTTPSSPVNFFSLGLDATPVRYNNMHFSTPIPASDFQYSWINAAISGSNWEADQKVLTYAPKSGMMSSSIGFTEAIIFPAISDISCCFDELTFRISYDISEGNTNIITTDTTLTVSSTDSGTTGNGQIYQNDIVNMDVQITDLGCCTDDTLKYRIVSVPSTGLTIDTGWQTTEQDPPSNIIKDNNEDNPGSIVITFYVQDCDGNIKTIVVTLLKAKFNT